MSLDERLKEILIEYYWCKEYVHDVSETVKKIKQVIAEELIPQDRPTQINHGYKCFEGGELNECVLEKDEAAIENSIYAELRNKLGV